MARNNTRQNCDTMQPWTHILRKSRRSALSSAAFSRHCTPHNRISLPTNILICVRPAFNGRTSGHRLINIRVVNFILSHLIMPRRNPCRKEKPRSTVEKMERRTGLNKPPAYMKRRRRRRRSHNEFDACYCTPLLIFLLHIFLISSLQF